MNPPPPSESPEPADRVEGLLALLSTGRGQQYFGEPVTQLEHALQTAALAEREGASDHLVVAALLHDIGHLLHEFDENIAADGVDAKHERVAGEWLAAHFDAGVTGPARLHVDAKRYLCAVDPAYVEGLSDASRDSLALQGGPMDEHEQREFEANPWWRDAVTLRRWDDAAKVPGLAVPDLPHYRSRIEGLMR
jgi:phosphonate degradation associated HDIG domain protein